MDNGALGWTVVIVWGVLILTAGASLGMFYGLRALLRKITGRR